MYFILNENKKLKEMYKQLPFPSGCQLCTPISRAGEALSGIIKVLVFLQDLAYYTGTVGLK